MKTKVFIEDFKGQKIFSLFDVDEKGEKIGQYPILSFGGRKASQLSDHIKELESFAKEYLRTPTKRE